MTLEESPSNQHQAQLHGILRAALSISSITLLSRILGLVREQIRAHYLGTSMASDAFGIAFQIPNLLRRLVGEGAMSAGFIPVLSEYREKQGNEAAFTFARQFFNLSLLALAVLSTLGVVGAGVIVTVFAWIGGQPITLEARELTISLTQVMFPYIALVSWAAVAQGILNTFRIFWVSAFTAVLLNLAIITTALLMAGSMEQPAYAFAIGVLVGGLLQFFFQIPYVYRLGFRWRPDFRLGPGVKNALVLLVPTLFGAGVYQINVLVSQAIAWGIGDGAVSSLQYSSRLLELTLGVFAVALSTVILPSLSRQVAAARLDEVRQTILFSVRLTCFICFPVTVGLYLTRSETVSLLFERGTFGALSTSMTGYALAFHIVGLTFIALTRVVIPVFYAFKDTWRPFWAAAASMTVNISLCYALAPYLDHGGIALANSISAVVQLLVLAALLARHLDVSFDRETLLSITRSAIATTGMGITVILGRDVLGTASMSGAAQLLLPYLAVVSAAVIVFVMLCLVVKHPELDHLIALARRKRG